MTVADVLFSITILIFQLMKILNFNFLKQLLSAKMFALCNQHNKDKYHIWNEEKKLEII